jgi:group II intron reverse transcriptase/maturase
MESPEGKMAGSPSSEYVSTQLQRVAQKARDMPTTALTTLAHHIDAILLHEAYLRTRKSGAVGVDGQTAEQYGEGLTENLKSLLNRFKSGTYKAPPVRRVHIEKGDGKTRPIGIPTYEDKILQRAVAMVLGAVYEQEFRECSYGFRPGRSAHQALEALWKKLMDMGGGIVVDVDVQAFFDSMDHVVLREFLDRRVRDGVLRRAVDKWLSAGVLEEGIVIHPETGTPQGGVISPLLANVYLHEVLDRWFEETVKPRMEGEAFLVRYADDFVMVLASPRDAQRVMKVLAARFAKYKLTVHPNKTRVVDFSRPRLSHEGKKQGSFAFLGFTHYWGRTRKGTWAVKRKTESKRIRRAAKAVAQWCRTNRHLPLAEQHHKLGRKIQGHCAYYGITGNSQQLERFRDLVVKVWRKWLNRRGQRKGTTWEWLTRFLRRHPLPKPIAVHSVLRGRAASP